RRRRSGRLPKGVAVGWCWRVIRAAALQVVWSRRGGPQGGSALLEACHPDRLRSRRGHHELRVQRQPARGGGLRTAVLEIHGGAAARVREGGGPAGPRASPGRLGGGRQARRRPHPRDQLAERLVPLLRAAHVPPGQRLRRDHGKGRRLADHGPRGRRLRPHRVLGAALHRQPARLAGHRPPAPRHRPGRGRLRPVLRRPRADRLRRHRHRMCVRLGGPGRRLQRLQARHHPLLPGQVGDSTHLPVTHDRYTLEGHLMSTPTRITHLVSGADWQGTAERTSPVFNPATGEQAGVLDLASADLVGEVVATAKAAWPAWAETSLAKRTTVLFAFRQLLDERKKEIGALITAEHGKVLDDAVGEVTRGLEVAEFACGIPHLLKGGFSENASTTVDVYSMRQPLGVCAVISPFNFPAMVPMWFIPIAIACGNAVVLKPSEKDPSAALAVARLWKEAGLPDGIVNAANAAR